MKVLTTAACGLAVCLAASVSLAAETGKTSTPPAPAAEAKDAKADAAPKGVKPAGPRLQMGEAHAKHADKERDKRQCLDLPTPQEVIRCTERK